MHPTEIARTSNLQTSKAVIWMSNIVSTDKKFQRFLSSQLNFREKALFQLVQRKQQLLINTTWSSTGVFWLAYLGFLLCAFLAPLVIRAQK